MQKILLKQYKFYWKRQWSKPLWQHLRIGVIIILTLWSFGISFFFNVDQSLTPTFFIAKRNPTLIPKYSYVLFDHTVFGKKRRLVKKVLGVYHDVISIKNNEVWVNETFIGTLKSHSKEGIPLQSITPQIIPEGFIFVAGTHSDSFDSRYQAFGLISTQHILARAYPLF